MRSVPLCRRCGTHHWNMKPCPEKPVVSAPVFRVLRPRDGFRDRADVLDPATVRMGETTFARVRTSGERHGSFRTPEGEAA